MICKSCGYDDEPDFIIVGLHTGAYCAHCGKWLRWVPKKQAKNVEIKLTTHAETQNIENDDKIDLNDLPW